MSPQQTNEGESSSKAWEEETKDRSEKKFDGRFNREIREEFRSEPRREDEPKIKETAPGHAPRPAPEPIPKPTPKFEELDTHSTNHEAREQPIKASGIDTSTPKTKEAISKARIADGRDIRIHYEVLEISVRSTGRE